MLGVFIHYLLVCDDNVMFVKRFVMGVKRVYGLMLFCSFGQQNNEKWQAMCFGFESLAASVQIFHTELDVQ